MLKTPKIIAFGAGDFNCPLSDSNGSKTLLLHKGYVKKFVMKFGLVAGVIM
jgi:hypothetical protein